jgi:4-diphosphocytidyl-2-C-methyl-D-erythritol kinase
VRLRLFAPAKVNWTLEVLGRREDGYHEVATILQTLDVGDRVTLSPDDEVRLRVSGRSGGPAEEPPERNLAFRAAMALRQEVGGKAPGALIELEKVVPAAAGLGGGSSDAAAVLRGLNVLWGLGRSLEELSVIGSTLGADVPFFLYGGTAQASGRGNDVAPLPDAPSRRLLIVLPSVSLSGKTAEMYRRLTPEQYTKGERTRRLADKLVAGGSLGDDDVFNVFEGVLADALPEAAAAVERCRQAGLDRPHLAGSGPALFYLLPEGEETPSFGEESLSEAGLELLYAGTLGREAAAARREEA